MNCHSIKEKIDQLVFEKNDQDIKEIKSHINTCDSCAKYFNDNITATRIIRLMQHEPYLSNPDDLTNNILDAIEEVDQIPHLEKSNTKIIRIVRRLLAAASVLIIIIFGIEQWVVIDKVSRLEKYASNAQTENRNISYETLISFNTGMQFNTGYEIVINKFVNPAHQQLDTRIMIARLSAIPLRQFDKQRINKLFKSATTIKTR
ncbi:MAG: hypothetical protein HQ521_01665 [Bacteroidetes bacterium]|nr:hypothetical protein [Bacteroidota bacterium]